MSHLSSGGEPSTSGGRGGGGGTEGDGNLFGDLGINGGGGGESKFSCHFKKGSQLLGTVSPDPSLLLHFQFIFFQAYK